MKFLRPLAALSNPTDLRRLADAVLDVFRQVDRWFQQANARSYQVRMRDLGNQRYDLTVVDRNGLPVDQAVVLVYIVESERGDLAASGAINVTSDTPAGWASLMYHPDWRSIIMRLPAAGVRLVAYGNARARLRACVLGIEEGGS